MKRRSFLKYSTALSTPILIGGIPVASIARNALNGLVNGESDRVLILIQLNGGNDGLSTIFPMDSYDVLANVRSNIIIPEDQLLEIEDTNALHPSMTNMKSLYDDGKVNIIQNVGYPQQNRSHFRSSDIWHSGSSANEFLNTGWLGRYFDSKYPGYPSEYPNEECRDPFALTIGSIVSETCQGLAGSFSMALVDPNNINQLSTPINNEVASGCGADQLDFLSNAIEKSNEYGERMTEAYDLGSNMGTLYGGDNRLANQLKTVARLISGGLQTKVYVVSLGGFDTHADQTDENDPAIGEHSTLLKTLSDAIYAFQDDITQLGLADRVLGMTYSEFGRRIRSNFSFGTDHGDAAPLILFGNCVNPGIIGTNPVISPYVEQGEGLPMEHDFRSIYGSVLMDWFEVPEAEVIDLFNDEFSYIPIATSCESSTSTNEVLSDNLKINTYPNPTTGISHIEFDTGNERVKLSLFNSLGSELKVISNRQFSRGLHKLNIDLTSYPAGHYYIKLQTEKSARTVKLLKV